MGSDQRQPRLAEEIERLAVPAAPERLRMPIRPTILPSSQPLHIAAAVLQEQDAAAWPAHSSHLPQRGPGIGECAYGEGRDDCVKGAVRESKGLGVHL